MPFGPGTFTFFHNVNIELLHIRCHLVVSLETGAGAWECPCTSHFAVQSCCTNSLSDQKRGKMHTVIAC